MNVAKGSGSKQGQRAERILDAAAELVLRWGYKRVTIEEVAKRAAIGKGTVYLHWKTREALFLAVMAREGTTLCDEIIAAMRADPAEILPHRMTRRVLLLMEEHPLLQALFSRDTEVLGGLVDERSGQALRGQKSAFTREYLELLRSRGLLRTDLALDAQFYAVNATIIGFYLIDALVPAERKLPFHEKAEIAAATLRNAFEPQSRPDPEILRALAPTVIAGVERLRAHYAEFAQGTPTAARESPEE